MLGTGRAEVAQHKQDGANAGCAAAAELWWQSSPLLHILRLRHPGAAPSSARGISLHCHNESLAILASTIKKSVML